jgi:hypothetical protein
MDHPDPQHCSSWRRLWWIWLRAHLRPARVVREVCGVICMFSETLCQKLVIFILENIHINVTARRGRPIICTNNLSISCLSDKESDLWLVDPDPGGPKTYGTDWSGSATLEANETTVWLRWWRSPVSSKHNKKICKWSKLYWWPQVVVDLVAGHTSDQHEWSEKSVA